ncbi:ATP synthase subunit I [Evansella halocellulosilytica]|uniref:ATP synthase subunit I n=1 Tax=Evansella halocellulosilytica TaxID=2011013 RepID=UPI000BB76FA8|nr:ATP synthase subunit I [Evansella halocellulosilytica]
MDYTTIAKRYTFFTLTAISVFLVAAFFMSETSFFLGLALGASFSLVNFLSTYLQVKRLGQVMTERKYRFSFGTVTRLFTVVVAFIIALEFPDTFDLVGVIIGLAVTYLLVMFGPIIQMKQFK